jgi:hypothetical protein
MAEADAGSGNQTEVVGEPAAAAVQSGGVPPAGTDGGSGSPPAAQPSGTPVPVPPTPVPGQVGDLPDWAAKEMAAKYRQLRTVERQLEEERARNAEQQRQLSTQYPSYSPPVDPATQQPPVGYFRTEAEYQAAVQANARNLATLQIEQQKFFDETTKAWEKGGEAYGREKFDAAIARIPSVFADINGAEVMKAILATDNPAKVLYELGSDLKRASEIHKLPMARRANEFFRLSQPNAPENRQTSRATPPIEPINTGTGGSISNDLYDKNITDARWDEIRSRQKRELWLRRRGKVA